MFAGIRKVAGAAIITAGLSVPASAATTADSYSSFWVLGDSLSDSGNLAGLVYDAGTDFNSGDQIGTGSYYRGRFTNGPTWAENVAGDFAAAGKATANLAHGGSEALEPDVAWDLTPGLDYQKAKLVLDHAEMFGARPLVSIMTGANDLMAAVARGDFLTVASEAADAIAAAAREIAQHGVGDFLIANMPDLANTPRYTLFSPELRQDAHDAAVAFNDQLAGNIGAMRADGLNVAVLDLWSVLGAIQAQPAEYGLADPLTPCLFPSEAGIPACDDAESVTRLFFDAVHPNLRVHQAFGDAVSVALAPAPIPLPGGLPLLIGGILAFAGVARRQSA